ncbi:MAG: nucleoside kinase [Candidatus Delongbacteria bacterium]|nr:nucleoside kinase [Candidatus Delongbacteria bacterium]MCG2760561.1 nucleoside kinase [Candidatus Delongbacteria bacterium]
MVSTIQIRCLNSDETLNVPTGSALSNIAQELKLNLNYPVIGAIVNNTLKELSYPVTSECEVEFIDITDSNGLSVYIRSLIFIMCKAVNDLFPVSKLYILHAISKGYYCELTDLNGNNLLNLQSISNIMDKMKEIIGQDLPFERFKLKTEDAINQFINQGLDDKELILKQRKRIYTSVYKLDGIINYLYGYLAPSTGSLGVFNLVKYFDGMLLQIPSTEDPDKIVDQTLQNKLFEVINEHSKWVKLLEVENVGKLNQHIINKNAGNLIKIAEALHEKKVAYIADMISERKNVKLVMISGPSSSGKTTFSKRLSVQLQVAGLKPLIISLDDYFVDREYTPRDVNGEYDFETIEAIDIKLFNEHLLRLFDGEEVEIPKFDFVTGKRLQGRKIRCEGNNIILVEGIHALNPNLTLLIENSLKFKIYVSALTQISIDRHNRIPTTDNRLIRRIVRDYNFRSHSALATLKRWPSVTAGEEKNIFPYQEEADIMFNSALMYEFSVLKHFAEPIINEVPENTREYAEAMRLLKFLSFFLPITNEDIPNTSIIKEFIGGSSFEY